MNGLVLQLTEVFGLAETAVWQAALVFLRIGAAAFLIPALGEQSVPQRIRLAAALAMTVIVAPGVPPLSGPPTPSAIFAEVAAGLAIGLGLRLLILALQTAGTIIAQSVSLAQMFAGTGPEPQPIVANLLVLAGIAVFVGLGGLERSVALLLMSYDLVPLGQTPDPAALADWGLSRIIALFALAFALAAPFLLAALLYNLALGLINRVMPTLMVTFIGAPALSLGGLALLALVSPLVLEVWRGAVDRALSAPFGG
jgi:flagellar biosynthetic protein FliR